MSARARFRRLTVVLLTTFGVAAGSLAAPPAATAATASISGFVTVQAGSPSAVCVTAHRYDEWWDEYVEAGSTCATGVGSYVIDGLAAGTYTLQFDDTSHQNSGVWWDNAEYWWDATDFPVPAGGAVTGKNASLAATSTIEGTVTASGGVPVEPLVHLYRFVDGDWEDEATVYGQEDGTYVASGLRAGTYRVCFQPAHRQDLVGECWDDVESWDTATPIVAAAGATVSHIDAELGPGGDISGVVTSETDGQPLEDVVVSLMYFDDEEGYWRAWTSRGTDEDGRYSLQHLHPGTYRLKLGGASLGFHTEYWDDKATLDAAADLRIDHGTDLVLDAALREKSSISGTLTDSQGAPAADVCVNAAYLSGSSWVVDRVGCTDDTGHYRIRGVTPRTYRLHFEPSDGEFVEEWWQDAATAEAATDVVVPVDTAVVRDGVLSRTSEIHGQVHGPTGAPQSGVGVQLWRFQSGAWAPLRTAWSDATGAYRFLRVRPGSYKLRYLPTTTTLGEWWDDATTQETATEIVVGVEQVLTGYDATLRPPSTISGRLTTPSGVQVSDPQVTVYRQVTGVWTAERTVDGDWDGSFVVGGLEPGVVRLGFSRPGYITEYWQDVATVEAATDIHVGLGEEVTGLDAVVDPVTPPVIYNSVRPTISGTPWLGLTLTATSGSWSPADATYAYQWLADGVEIPGATTTTFVPTADEVGKTMTVRVTASRTFWTSSSATSNPTTIVRGGTFTTSTPTITGVAKVGQTLTAVRGTWTPSDATFDYQWLVDGWVISGETGTTFTISSGYATRRIQVRVTGSRPGYATTSVDSAQTDPVEATPLVQTSPASISGSPLVGSVLTATPGTWSLGDAEFHYQWLVGGEPIYGAYSRTWKVDPAALGKVVSVRIQAHVPGADATADAPGVLIQKRTITVLKEPTLSGKARVGGKLRVFLGTYLPKNAGQRVKWLIDGKALRGARGTRLALTTDHLGHRISVRIVVIRHGYKNLTLKTNVKRVKQRMPQRQ